MKSAPSPSVDSSPGFVDYFISEHSAYNSNPLSHTQTLFVASMILLILSPLPGLVGSFLFFVFVFFGLVLANSH